MANRANKNTFSNQGFTLVELAIVLVIVGLLVGLGTSMVGPLMTATKVRETRDNLDANSQAIASWASANNRLPSGAEFTSPVAKTPQDAWGRDFIYLYDTNLNITPTKDTICGRRSTNLTVQSTDPVATISNVAYIILSASDDATIQTTLNNTVAPLPLVSPPTLNGGNFTSGNTIALNTRGYATGTVILDPNNRDLVRWVTLDELRTKVGCQGAPLKIVNNELPFGNFLTPYLATIASDGGTGGYKWRVKSYSVPRGIIFNNDTMQAYSTAGGSKFNNNSTSTWFNPPTPTNLTIGGSPRPAGSYSLTVQVQDNNGNYASKPYVMTINPN